MSCFCRKLVSKQYDSGEIARKTSTGSNERIPPTISNDAETLALLFSHLAPEERIPLDFLRRGGGIRRRWTSDGRIAELSALDCALDTEVSTLLSDEERVHNAMLYLESIQTISCIQNGYILTKGVANDVCRRLSEASSTFWKHQCLILAYRAISWKYLEPCINDAKSYTRLLQYTLCELNANFEDWTDFTRLDLALTLIEAARFPGLEWKHFCLSQAEIAAHDLQDPFLGRCLAQAKSVLARLKGNMTDARDVLKLTDGILQPSTRQMHAAAGFSIMQQSLNHIQVEETASAEHTLKQWNPIDQASDMESVVLFRKHMLLGRSLRYRGKFTESLEYLDTARIAAEQLGNLRFDEDYGDLLCDLSDTLRELNQLDRAKDLLENFLRTQECIGASPRRRLQLSLAEVLFARGQFDDASLLCQKVLSQPKVLKFEELRASIILAKIQHSQMRFQDALVFWTRALTAVNQFQITGGRTTRVIVCSMTVVLSQLGYVQERLASIEQVKILDATTKSDGVEHWIAGTRHWADFLGPSASFKEDLGPAA